MDGVDNVELLDDWVWCESFERWVLHVRLTPDICEDGPIPPSTEWYVLVDSDYPMGSIQFYPAKRGGITQTFHHQSHNGYGENDMPWRNGDLCLNTIFRSLGCYGYDLEPYDAEHRLQWHFRRALEWLRRASHHDLVRPDDPFELPAYPVKCDEKVAFSEDTNSFARWQRVSDSSGIVEFYRFETERTYHIVKSFKALDGSTILAPKWGRCISETNHRPKLGVWLRVNDTLVLEPWQAPVSWDELITICNKQDIDIMGLLEPVADFIRDAEQHIALIGFPIPVKFGGVPCQMHWQSIKLPVLSHGKHTANGFRTNHKGYWHRDRTEIIRSKLPLCWMNSENWNAEQITTRGRLSQELRQQNILLIGAGAVGAPLSELLIRGGAYRVGIIDDDSLGIGNLVRHTLSLENLGEKKAKAIAERLNTISPFASAESIVYKFPPTNQIDIDHIQQYDVIIDCTADDQLLCQLGLFPWNTSKFFFSISLGYGAKRMYCFSAFDVRFPTDVFQAEIAPWLTQSHDQLADREFPWEGIGCWHPVFPATVDDVWMMASIAAKYINANISSDITTPCLEVFEQHTDEYGLSNVNRLIYRGTDA